ncbi:unnamed protein product [Closterium sp. Naga37s-1]|nr:unnamed protein product [Closterium sp. Naga37s-1]
MDASGDRALEDLLEVEDPWATNLQERLKLLKHWLEELKATANAAIEAEVRNHAKKVAESRELMDIEDLQVLRKAQVVGMTTSGVAKMQRLITALGPRVIIVEEAAEVLEAHILTSLTLQTEHVILIGDHLQLRPKVEVYELSKDSHKGFDLDVSLFERLALSKQIPVYTLATQRRMRSEIADLIRSTIYPQLTDHPSVQSYPDVRGMATNLHFWDHDSPEKGGDYLNESKSKTNEGEVDLVVGLATYLLQQGYAGGEITILTLYVGQLLKLRQALSRVVNVKLGESDAEVVEEAEEKAAARGGGSRERDGRSNSDSSHGSWLQSKGPGPGESPLVPSTADLKDEVRLATVDNFQGEESTVIIISLVRNNGDGKIGFLKSPNRTNVLLSRAKHGMYIVDDKAKKEQKGQEQQAPGLQQPQQQQQQQQQEGVGMEVSTSTVPKKHKMRPPVPLLVRGKVPLYRILHCSQMRSVTGFMAEAERLRAASMNPPTWKTYQACIAALQRKHALLGGPAWSGGRGGASGAGDFIPAAASLEEECRLLYVPQPDARPPCESLIILAKCHELLMTLNLLQLRDHLRNLRNATGQRSAPTIEHYFYQRVRECRITLHTCLNNARECLVAAVDWAGKCMAHRLEARARLELVGVYRAYVEGMMAERLLSSSTVDQNGSKAQQLEYLEKAKILCHMVAYHPMVSVSNNALGERARKMLQEELPALETSVRDEPRYFVLTEREKDEVYRAMGFGTGHWYRCRNGHVYAIGECGGAMQESRCPECGEVVGGSSHQLREGNTSAADFFSGLNQRIA